MGSTRKKCPSLFPLGKDLAFISGDNFWQGSCFPPCGGTSHLREGAGRWGKGRKGGGLNPYGLPSRAKIIFEKFVSGDIEKGSEEATLEMPGGF